MSHNFPDVTPEPPTKLLRRPRPPRQVKIKEPTFATNTDVELFSGSSSQTDNFAFGRDTGQRLTPVASVQPSLIAPPPSMEPRLARERLLRGTRTSEARTKIEKWEKKYVLDPHYDSRHTTAATQSRGVHTSLTKPYRTRGPAALPMRLPTKRNMTALRAMIAAGADEEEMDERFLKPRPLFTLNTVIRGVSETLHVNLDRVANIMLSSHSYKRLTQLLHQQMFPPNRRPPTIIDVDENTRGQFKEADNRLPAKQILLEMTALIKQRIQEATNTDVTCQIRPLPKYDPHYRIGQAPHTEILVLEAEKRQELERFVQFDHCYQHPPQENMFTIGGEQRYQDSRRGREPFGMSSVHSRCYSEFLGALVNGETKSFAVDSAHVSPLHSNADETSEGRCSPAMSQATSMTSLPLSTVEGDQISPAEVCVLDCIMNGGEALSMKGSFVKQLPDVSFLVQTLTYVNISYNNFTVFPAELFLVKQLRVLKMRNNPISVLPIQIGEFSALRMLVASFCLIDAVPMTLYALKELRVLDLSYNRLTELHTEISRLKQLTRLNVEGNELTGMPCGLLKLRLREIRLRNNFLHPLFWKENSASPMQKLVHLAALAFVQSNLETNYAPFGINKTAEDEAAMYDGPVKPELPAEAKEVLRDRQRCDCCQGPLYGPGVKIIRPCRKLFGVKMIPILFRSCSPYCLDAFKGSYEQIVSMLYEEEDPEDEVDGALEEPKMIEDSEPVPEDTRTEE